MLFLTLFTLWLILVSTWALHESLPTKRAKTWLGGHFFEKPLPQTKESPYELELNIMRRWENRFAMEDDKPVGSGLNELIQGYAKGKVSLKELEAESVFHSDTFLPIKILAEQAANEHANKQTSFDKNYLSLASQSNVTTDEFISKFLDGEISAGNFSTMMRKQSQKTYQTTTPKEHRETVRKRKELIGETPKGTKKTYYYPNSEEIFEGTIIDVK